MPKDFELERFLNGTAINDLAPVKTLAKDYAELKAGMGNVNWKLDENGQILLLELSNKTNADKYAKALQEKLASFGANQSNIQVKPHAGAYIIEVDKNLIWQQLGQFETLRQLNMWENDIQRLINSLTQNPREVAVVNLNERIRNFLELAEYGSTRENLPAFPQWFLENKNTLQNWLALPHVREETKQLLMEILDPSLRQAAQQAKKSETEAVKANMEISNILTKLNTLMESVATNLYYDQKIQEEYYRSNKYPPKSEILEIEIKMQNTLNAAIAVFINNTLNKLPADKNGNISYPDWFETYRDVIVQMTESDYVDHNLKQQILKHINPKDVYNRTYQAKDPMIKKIMAALDNQEKIMQQEMAKHIPGGKDLGFHVDDLLKSLEYIDKSNLSSGAKIEYIHNLLTNFDKKQTHGGLRKIVSLLTSTPEVNEFLSQTRTNSEKIESQIFGHLQKIEQNEDSLKRSYGENARSQTIITPTIFAARKIMTSLKMNESIKEILKIAPSQWFVENNERVEGWIKNGYVSHDVRQELQKKINPSSYVNRTYQAEDLLVKMVIAKMLDVEKEYVEARAVQGISDVSINVDKLLKRLQTIDKQGKGEPLLIAEAMRSFLDQRFTPEKLGKIMKIVKDDPIIQKQLTAQLLQRVVDIPSVTKANQREAPTEKRKTPILSQHRGHQAHQNTKWQPAEKPAGPRKPNKPS